MKNVIFIAAPATGKGTFSNMLMERYGYNHISTGDLLRNIVKTNTSLGNEVAEVLKSGKLVNDELIFKILKEALKQMDLQNPFIIDGLPRNINQAYYLNNLFNDACFMFCLCDINSKFETLLFNLFPSIWLTSSSSSFLLKKCNATNL